MWNLENPWLRHEDLGRYVESIDDERLRAFIEFGITTILTKRGLPEDAQPIAPFDLQFFVEVLTAMFRRQDVMKSVLDGELEQYAWWPKE